jgi:hypothetical protein
MSRRHAEQEFGSDSFLDVIANVVGILIILVVIVGVRAGQAPVQPPHMKPEPEVAAAVPAPPPPVVAIAAPEPEPLVELEPIILVEPAPPPPAAKVIVVEQPLPNLNPATAPEDLVARTKSLMTSIQDLEKNRTRLSGELQQSQQRSEQLQQQLASAQRSAQSAEAQRKRVKDDLAAGRAELEETLAELVQLKESLSDADEEPDAVEIQHRVNPIGKSVTGQEIHFYLSKGTVAHVPVDALAARLKLHIERQKELLVKMDRYEGSIDPIDGFHMQYVLQKCRMSLAEELKYGQNLVRMQVTQWILVPEPGLKMETADQAMQRGSDFYQSLLTAGPTTTLTFWVYPDSFDTCAKLKDFVHRHGYEVAARPLPFGVPIAGSPEGSKSVAQ